MNVLAWVMGSVGSFYLIFWTNDNLGEPLLAAGAVVLFVFCLAMTVRHIPWDVRRMIRGEDDE